MVNVGGALFRFLQPITVNRQGGSWVAGVWTPTAPQALPMLAVVTVPDATELQMLPEGDQELGAIELYVAAPNALYVTSDTGTSDQIVWNGSMWRVMRVWDLSAYGYWRAIAVKMDPTAEP